MGEGVYIVVVEAVAQVDAEAGLAGHGDGGEQAFEFGLPGEGGGGVGVCAGVQFDVGRAGGDGGFDLGGFGVDEKRSGDAGGFEGGDEFAEFLFAAGDAEAAFGGEFLAFFGHEADHVGPKFQGDAAHFVGGGHFQVQAGFHGLSQEADIAVLDMAAVLAQMDDDGARAGQFGHGGGGHGVGAGGEACLADGGHMIDVDRK